MEGGVKDSKILVTKGQVIVRACINNLIVVIPIVYVTEGFFFVTDKYS